MAYRPMHRRYTMPLRTKYHICNKCGGLMRHIGLGTYVCANLRNHKPQPISAVITIHRDGTYEAH